MWAACVLSAGAEQFVCKSARALLRVWKRMRLVLEVLDASLTLPSHSPDTLLRDDEVDDRVSKLHVALQLWAGSVLVDVVNASYVDCPSR